MENPMKTTRTPITPVKQAFVEIAGHRILAFLLPDNRIVAAFRMICNLLGVDHRSQLRRVQADPTLSNLLMVVKIDIVGTPQEMNVIVAEAIPMWLANIHESKVALEARETLAEFQRVAVQTLRAFFFPEPRAQQQRSAPPKAPPPPLPAQDDLSLSAYDLFRAAIARLEQEDLQREARLIQRFEQGHQRLEARIDSVDRQHVEDVARMAEKGHEISLQAEQIHALVMRVDRLEASGSRLAEQPGEARGPIPSLARLQALKTMPYQEYLQTPEWKAKREAALKRAWYCCQVCNDNKTPLHVHHRTYERRGHEQPEDLFVLCESCHARYDPRFAARQKKAGKVSPAASEQEAIFPPFPDYEI
jgi:hypothetical protein